MKNGHNHDSWVKLARACVRPLVYPLCGTQSGASQSVKRRPMETPHGFETLECGANYWEQSQ